MINVRNVFGIIDTLFCDLADADGFDTDAYRPSLGLESHSAARRHRRKMI